MTARLDALVTTLTRRALPLLIVLGTFAALARLAGEPLANPDTFFHLRIGHEFLIGSWSVAHPGHLSPLEHNAWAPTQWLSQVVMAAVEAHVGLAGVAWLSGLLFVGLAATHYVAARRESTPLVAATLVPIAVLASTAGLSMRPQVLSYLFTSVTVMAWLRCRATGRTPWMLVPLTWLWASLHGMWPVGLVVSAVAVAGLVLDERPDRRRIARLAAVPVLCAVAAALTPVGPRLYAAVLLVNSRSSYFTEWGPPDFARWDCLCLLLLLGTTVVALLRRTTPVSWLDVALLLTAGGWAVYSLRTVPVAAAIAVPLAARALQPYLPPRGTVTRSEVAALAGGATLALAVLAAVVPHTAAQPAAVVPRGLDERLAALPPHTRVLDEMQIGSYLLWRFPELDVAVHGYGDVYTADELAERARLSKVQRGWQTALRRLDPDVAVLDGRSALAYVLTHGQGWTVARPGTGAGDLELLVAPDRRRE